MSRFSLKKFSFSKLPTAFYHLLLGHFNQLLVTFDPVKDAQQIGITSKEELLFSLSAPKLSKPSKPRHQINYTYLIPALSLVFIETDTVFTYYKASYPDQSHLLDSVFARRTFPKRLWSVSDVMVEMGLFMSALVYVYLLFDQGLEDKLKLYLFVDEETNPPKPEIVQNGKLLNATESTQIYLIRRSMLKALRLAMFGFCSVIILFFGGHLVFSWQHFSLAQNLLKVFEFALFAAYFPLSNVYIILYFLLVVRYVRIKQKVLEAKVAKLKTNVESQNRPNKNSQVQLRFWKVFKGLTGEMAKLFDFVGGLNRYFSNILTVYFSVYIAEICYFTYALVFIRPDLLLDVVFLVTFIVEFSGMLNLVTLECSKVVGGNVQMHRAMDRISVRMLKTFGKVGKGGYHKGYSHQLLSLSELLKLDQMTANSRNVTKVCFRLLDNYRINSRMFLTVIESTFCDLLIFNFAVLFLDFLLHQSPLYDGFPSTK